jgi:hypothetical protein
MKGVHRAPFVHEDGGSVGSRDGIRAAPDDWGRSRRPHGRTILLRSPQDDSYSQPLRHVEGHEQGSSVVVAVAGASLVAGHFAESGPASTSAGTCITQVVGEKDRSGFLVLRRVALCAGICARSAPTGRWCRSAPRYRTAERHSSKNCSRRFGYKGRRLDFYAYYKNEAEKTMQLVLRQRGVTSWYCNGAG